jgi:HK97 family phage prohead protease
VKIEFVAVPVTLDAAAGEDSPRTITGVAVPWDTPATVSSGESVMFRKGAFDVNAKAPKLLEGHDMTQLRGVVTELVEAEEGLLFTAKFANTRASDEAIELVKAGAYDSVSVGAIPVKYKFDKNGTMVVSKANLVEISLVAQPAFADAVITEIAASQPDEESEEEVVEPQPLDISEEETMSTDTPTVEASAEIVPTAPIFAQAKREFKMPSAGEWLSAQMQGGSVAAEFNARLRAAAPDVVSSDLDGILPLPIVSPIYNNFRGLRPVIDAVGVRQLPAGGKVFIRPVVTTHTSMAVATENTAIQAGTFVVNDVQITKGIYGGYVEVSEASLDWTQPEVLNAMLDDMGRVYANTVDNVAADALEAGTTNTNNFTAADIAKPEVWVAWIYQAASDILTGSNGNLPTHLFMAPNRWASLGNLSDDSGRPLFPNIGPMNALGQLAPGDSAGNAFGLQVVVDRNLPSGTLIIGDATSGGFECWEQMKGAVSIEQPSTLSRQIAFRGYFAAKMIDDTKFIKAAFV